jgi:hypothetical protein
VPAGMRETRYWHEITRSHWHNRLGNLLLLQPSGREVSCGGDSQRWLCRRSAGSVVYRMSHQMSHP